MQISLFELLNIKLKGNVQAFIWYQLCQFILKIG